MLDRRAGIRAEPLRHLAAGSIEKTVQDWFDDPLGLYSGIQDKPYGDKMATHAVIDWGLEFEDQSKPGKERGARF
jgi:hypothetical protein